MADIIGFTRAEDHASIAERLKAMMQVLGAPLASGPCFSATRDATAVGSTQATDCVCNDEGLLVTLAGSPHWSDRSLQQLVADKGLALSIAEAFRRHGTGLLGHLRGPFALSIAIPAEERVFLAVDRLGIRPLAWAQHRGNIVFSSNAEAVQAYPGLKSGIDRQALFNYFYFHMVPSPGTIYEGIEKLMPGQCVDIRGNRVERSFYWTAPYAESPSSETELAADLGERLQQAVEAATTAGVKTGTFLSGGLDSSTVSGYFSRIAEGQADAYGIGFDAEGYDEMTYARASAAHFGIKLHEYYVTPEDVAEALPKVAAAYDEPFGNASAIPAYFCARVAQEDGKSCLLAGDGGDEIFAGNARYAKQQVFELYSRIPATLRDLVLEPLADHFPMGDRIPPIRKLRSYISQAKMPMPERLESYNFLHRTDIRSIFDDAILDAVDPAYPIDNQRDAYQRARTDSMVKKMLHLDLKITLADNDLRKVSRMCQLAGIDVRYPMLDEDLVEFSASVPTRLLLKRHKLRAFYKDALSDFLPPQTLAKRKHGFGLPFGVWMKSNKQLRELTNDSLIGLRNRGIIRASYIDRLLDAHRSEHADYYGVMIWVMMMLEQWLSAHGH